MAESESIEVFEIVSHTEFKYIRSIQHPHFRHINDVYAYSPEEIYVTNWQYYESGSLMDTIEKYLQFAWGYVLKCNIKNEKSECEIILKNMKAPNGINGYKEEVYIAETIGRRVGIYDRTNSGLVLKKYINAYSGVDNLDVDVNGDIYIGSHPKLLTFTTYASGNRETGISPSQIQRIKKGSNQVEEIFLSKGEDLKGSSVGVKHKDKLYIGGVFDEGVLVCDLKK